MQWLKALAAEVLREMQTDAARLPATLRETGEQVVAHEAALLAFADRELSGRADSLQPVREFLSRP